MWTGTTEHVADCQGEGVAPSTLEAAGILRAQVSSPA